MKASIREVAESLGANSSMPAAVMSAPTTATPARQASLSRQRSRTSANRHAMSRQASLTRAVGRQPSLSKSAFPTTQPSSISGAAPSTKPGEKPSAPSSALLSFGSGRRPGQVSRGLTPLQYASLRGFEGEAIIKVMLELQRDALLQHIHGPTQQSLLHWAAENNQVYLLESLMRHACRSMGCCQNDLASSSECIQMRAPHALCWQC